jgi:hypothetical protein
VDFDDIRPDEKWSGRKTGFGEKRSARLQRLLGFFEGHRVIAAPPDFA